MYSRSFIRLSCVLLVLVMLPINAFVPRPATARAETIQVSDVTGFRLFQQQDPPFTPTLTPTPEWSETMSPDQPVGVNILDNVPVSPTEPDEIRNDKPVGLPPFELFPTAQDIHGLIGERMPVVAATTENLLSDSRTIEQATAWVDSNGAAVTFLDEALAVIIGEKTFAEPVQIVMQRWCVTGRENVNTPDEIEKAAQDADETAKTFDNLHLPDGTVLYFSLEARKKPSGETVALFDRPVYLVLDVDKLAPELRWRSWYFAYEKNGWWFGLETHHSEDGRLIWALTDHFSVWSVGVQNTAWVFKWNEPTVSTFSGAATLTYPIEPPAGRGGLQPDINLYYSSRGADVVTFPNVDQGPIGLGWSINSIEIVREGVRTEYYEPNTFIIHPDLYSLVINGAAYELVYGGDLGGGRHRFYATNMPSLYVERRVGTDGTAAVNFDNYFWIVKTADGTVYRLGYMQDAITYQWVKDYCLLIEEGPRGSQYCNDSDNHYGSILRWHVDTVTDLHGNQMQYDYNGWVENVDQYGNPRENPYTRQTRIREIRYNNVVPATDPYTRTVGTFLSKVVFAQTADHRIDYIDLYHIDLNNRYRRIDLELGIAFPPDYCGRAIDAYTKLVWSIREYNGNGTAALPPTTFGFIALANYEDGGRWCEPYLRMQTVNNGRGGMTRFTYGMGDRRWQPFVGDGIPAWGQTFSVIQRETWDGVHSSPAVTQYSYNKPCYDQYDDGMNIGILGGAFNCPTRSNNGAYGHGNLVGFYESWITFKDYDGNELSRQYNRFSQNRWTMGYPLVQQIQDAYQRPRSETATAYTTINIGGGVTKYSYASGVDTKSYSPQVKTVRVEYTHDEYGNQILVKMHGDPALPDGEYRTEHEYYNLTNTGNGIWRIGLPKHTRTYSGISGGTLQSETRYAYDGLAYGTTPTKGLLTKTGTGLQGTLWVETQMFYTSPFDLLWKEIDPNGSQSTVSYETAYYLYPVQGCNALGQCSSAAYYGVDGVPADYGLRGQVKLLTDSNGVTTEYRYDSFGRLTGVLQPPDTDWSYPTSAYQYYDWSGFPAFYQAQQREEVGLAGTLQARAYHDGLGRTVQSLAEDDTSVGWASTYQRYNALGQVAEAYMPAEKGAAFSMYEAESGSLYHACGSSTSGGWLSPAVGSGGCHMTYGPYHAPAEVGPGQVARFRLSVDATLGMSNDVVAVIRVHDQTTNEWIAGRNVYRFDFSGG